MSFLKTLFSKRVLFFTNVFSSAGLMAAGDGIVQIRERMIMVCDTHPCCTCQSQPFDFRRSGIMLAMGFLLGPFYHFSFQRMGKRLDGMSMREMALSIGGQYAITAPLFSLLFIVGAVLLEGKEIAECTEEVSDKFLTLLIADLIVWPPIQLANFYFVAPRFRVIYFNSLALAWDVFLSHMKHKARNNDESNADTICQHTHDHPKKPLAEHNND